MSNAVAVFAENALALRRCGLAIIPIGRDRTPAVSGFSKWSRPPAERTVAKWVERHPSDNIAIVPGLSNVWVADADDASQVTAVEKLLGPTPLGPTLAVASICITANLLSGCQARSGNTI